MRDVMVVYGELLAERNLPPHDEQSAADRERFEAFKGGFVRGISETLLEVKNSCSCRVEVRPAVLVHGRN